MGTLLRRFFRLYDRVRGPAIPLATTAELAPAIRRTLALRVLFAAALIGLAVAASETGRSNAAAARGLLPGGTGGMLVLDVSRSIKPESNRTITGVLQSLIQAKSRIGLVAFSDIAYELLPPGSPSAELRPLLPYFAPARPRPGADPYPPNPWSSSFSGGTQISSGLTLAHSVLASAGEPKGEILLVSDLDTAPDDVPRVAETFNTFRNQGVPFRIIPVAPRADNLSLFQSIAGKKAFAKPVRSAAVASGQTEGAHRGQTPWTLIILALVLLAALAANEHWCGRLPVPRTQS
ncbi:MAG: VWA domain-containing protein [Actinobacteria bacterium]|nr:MAG: VWA domain-containing protein [Actinomycetota bacterium]